MTDCCLIGFNDFHFPSFVEMVRSMGEDSGAYRDLNLAFITQDGRPYNSMDMLNRLHFRGQPPARPWNNCDFLWPTITYLGTFLARHGFSFDYVNTFQLEKDALREKLLQGDILTIGITTTLYVSPHPILEIISFIRQYDERVKIVVGGPYISNQIKLLDLPSLQQMLKYLGADYYVVNSEGEQALVDLLTALKSGGDLAAIQNLAYEKDGAFVVNALSPESNALETNMIDYGLFPRQELGTAVSVRTAKSCPFACSFCGFPQRAGDYRYLSVELVEKELNALADLGVETVTFLDDTFNVPKKRFKEILHLMIRNRYAFKWNSFYRSDHGDAEIIELMGKAGCEGVFLGIESGSNKMLKNMNKTAHREDYLAAIPLLQGAGISVHANVIVGFPGETAETYEETIGLIEEAKPDFYRAQLWYADPVTPIWKRREEFAVKGSAFSWAHNTMDYQTACDWVDRMFLCIESSTWLPQNGFEQWSTFYLQRKGMTVPQIKRYLNAFNAIVKQKLLCPAHVEPDPRLLAELASAAHFDDPESAAGEPLRLYRGAEYTAAEDFWVEQFHGMAPSSGLLPAAVDGAAGAWAAERFTVPTVLVDRLRQRLDTGLESVLLAAYAALLSRMSAQEDLALLVVAAAAEPYPLRLLPSWEESFRAFTVDAERRSAAAARHAAFGLPVVANHWRMARRGAEVPHLEAAIVFGPPAAGGESGPPAALAAWPEVARGIALVLEARLEGDRVDTALRYRTGSLDAHAAAQLGGYLRSILEQVAERPDLTLGAIAVDPAAPEAAAAAPGDAQELFDF